MTGTKTTETSPHHLPDEPGRQSAETVREATCVACGHPLAATFFAPEPQPLVTLGWPDSAAAARSMTRLPLDFVRCLACGHVWNTRFEYAAVPYGQNPNRMFNRGSGWTRFLDELRAQLLARLPDEPTVVEIGCGEGHLLRGLAEQRPAGRYVGFDPNGAVDSGNGLIAFRQELFTPERHISELRPDLIVMRHVLEHLVDPRAFVQRLAYGAGLMGRPIAFYAEVPCIDRVLGTGRLADFFYEHASHFSSRSLAALLEPAAERVDFVETAYDGEVVCGLARLRARVEDTVKARNTEAFLRRSRLSRRTVAEQLETLRQGAECLVIWGGTGKAAAFINYYGCDAERFPLVVDSDPEKAGSFVPGTGQPIQFRDALAGRRVDILIVPMAWRAWDVCDEIRRCGLSVDRILIEHDGRLVDFLTDEHPYRRPARTRGHAVRTAQARQEAAA